ncbi:hypothetical protein NN561_017387 [Cricetulus griseus]
MVPSGTYPHARPALRLLGVSPRYLGVEMQKQARAAFPAFSGGKTPPGPWRTRLAACVRYSPRAGEGPSACRTGTGAGVGTSALARASSRSVATSCQRRCCGGLWEPPRPAR